MKKILLLLSLLSGCVVSQDTGNEEYSQKLTYWLGKPQWSLFAKWGQPDEQFAIDANTYVVSYTKIYKSSSWDRAKIYARELSSEALDIGPNYGSPQETPLYYCKTNFTIQNGRVVDFGFNGDNCI